MVRTWILPAILLASLFAVAPTASADDVCTTPLTDPILPVSACAGYGAASGYLLLPKPAPGCTVVAGQCVPATVVWGPEHADFAFLTVHASVDTSLCVRATPCHVGVDTGDVIRFLADRV